MIELIEVSEYGEGLIYSDIGTAMDICKDAVHSRGYHSLRFGEARLVCVKNDPRSGTVTRAVLSFNKRHSFVTYKLELHINSPCPEEAAIQRRMADLESAIEERITKRIDGAFDYKASRYFPGATALSAY